MGKLATITRRTFLIGSAAIAGGVGFGYYQYKKELPNPLEIGLQEGEAAINPFVKITKDGITLVTPRADKGQGSYSLQAHLLAEELDVDPTKVNLTPGRPSKAYYNGAVMNEAAPGLGDVIGKLMGLQMTGGSSTTPDMFDRLRQAGAVARETIKLAAAEKFSVGVDQLKTDDGHVVLPSGERISYTDLAAEAANVEPVNDVELRDSRQWRYIGKPVQRLDIIAKSTGTQNYGIDFRAEDLLFATARTNTAFGADAVINDVSKAEKMRGVKRVVPIKGGVGIIADNTWRAFQAAAAVDISWKAASYPGDSEAMWKVLEDHMDPEHKNVQRLNEGDAEAALGEGDVIEAEYRTPHLAHAPLEPINATVRYTDERVDIWTGTQIPRHIEDHVKKATGLEKENIHLHVLPMGGSFGRRLEDRYVMQALEIAQSTPGVPILMTWKREEDFAQTIPRPMTISRGRGKVANGQIDTMQLEMVCPSLLGSWFGRIAMAPPGPDATITQGADDQPFDIPNYSAIGYKSPEMVPVTNWRSVAASQNGFYHECFMDELIHAAGADPLQERLRLCNDPVSKQVLEEVGKFSNWNGVNLGENRGRGLAFVKAFGVPTVEVVDVTYTPRGIRIDDVYIVCDVGRVVDPVNIEAQIFGGVIWGLGHSINCEITYKDYTPTQTNYHAYQGLRMYQTPKIHIKVLENEEKVHGIGEPTVPPAGPALANAIFAATGQRVRELPLYNHIKFV